MTSLTTRSQRLARTISVVMVAALIVTFLSFLVPVTPARAQTTHHVAVGGDVTGVNITTGIIWFNSFEPVSIVIRPGDTVEWENVGTASVHTVTSTGVDVGGNFVYDSSPDFPIEAALGDIAAGLLLGPGGTFELDTGTLAPGTYNYVCKIHPGMAGSLTVSVGPVTTPVVTIIAGFGDTVYAHQAFVPRDTTVPRGTIVRWQLLNPTEPHTVTEVGTPPAWDSSPNFGMPPGPPPFLLPGQTFSHVFTTEGTHVYFCKLHAYQVGESWAGMVGTVHVLALDPAGAVNDLAVVAYVSLAVAILAIAVSIYSVTRRRGGS